MEQNQNTSLFGLGIDENSKAQLSEAARWAKFLAIAGFVGLGLMIIYGIYMSFIFSSMLGQMDDRFGGMGGSGGLASSLGAGMIVFYIIMAIIGFFPLLFLLRFSNKMKAALDSNDQDVLNESFRNLKVYYRYIGIITIISLVLIVISILMMIVGSSMLM